MHLQFRNSTYSFSECKLALSTFLTQSSFLLDTIYFNRNTCSISPSIFLTEANKTNSSLWSKCLVCVSMHHTAMQREFLRISEVNSPCNIILLKAQVCKNNFERREIFVLNYFSPVALRLDSGHGLHLRGFVITLTRHKTLGRTPLDEWSVRSRKLYLTTHNNHKKQTPTPRQDSKPQSQQASGRGPTP